MPNGTDTLALSVPAGDGVPGFLVDAKTKGKKAFAPMKAEMQFLQVENHKNLYEDSLDISTGKVEYLLQSEVLFKLIAKLQNLQRLPIMEIGLLMGCNIDWGTV